VASPRPADAPVTKTTFGVIAIALLPLDREIVGGIGPPK
jgi:hypothetical protein